jgi:hypothetical protein
MMRATIIATLALAGAVAVSGCATKKPHPVTHEMPVREQAYWQCMNEHRDNDFFCNFMHPSHSDWRVNQKRESGHGLSGAEDETEIYVNH